jgi:hypothetical protein
VRVTPHTFFCTNLIIMTLSDACDVQQQNDPTTVVT